MSSISIDPYNQIVIPRWSVWMMEHSDDPVSPEQAERVREIISTPPRDRSGSFSASSAGTCLRRQVLGFHGLPGKSVDLQLRNVFKDGHWRHYRWQSMLMDAGIIHQIEGTLKWKKMLTRGSIDGAGIVPMDHPKEEWRGKDFGLEIKGVSHFQFDKYDGKQAKEDHLNQVHRYFLLSGFELFVILYEDKTLQKVMEWVIEPDPIRMEEQRRELDTLVQHAENDTLPEILPSCAAMMGDIFAKCPYGTRSGKCLKIETLQDVKNMINDG